MKVKAVILAGGFGKRLTALTMKRAKPAVPFGGKYRIIDFVLSNCVNSGIFDVVILTQYRPHSLNHHIGSGRPWDLDRTFTGGVELLQPYKGHFDTDWYAGTADAVRQNLNFLRHGDPDYLLILTGDQIYRMNYAHFVKAHKRNDADVTVAVKHVPDEDTFRFGIFETDDTGRAIGFEEKPCDPKSNLASMGIYVFDPDTLERLLTEDHDCEDSSGDFGADILPRMVDRQERVMTWPMDGYWLDVGTLHAYWKAHMDLLHEPPSLDLNDRSWVIRTRGQGHASSRIGRETNISESIISDGCIIEDGASIIQSVLNPGVRVGPGAVIYQSVVLNDVVIDQGASLQRCILDKQAIIGARAHLGGLENKKLTTIGKSTRIPDGFVVEPGCILGPDLAEETFEEFDGRIPHNTEIGIRR